MRRNYLFMQMAQQQLLPQPQLFSQPQPLPQEPPQEEPPQENRRIRMMTIQSQLLLQELQNITVFLSPHIDFRDRTGAGGAARLHPCHTMTTISIA